MHLDRDESEITVSYAGYKPNTPAVDATGNIKIELKKTIQLLQEVIFLLDASVNYTMPKYEVGIALENITNTKWNEAQFATESRLRMSRHR